MRVSGRRYGALAVVLWLCASSASWADEVRPGRPAGCIPVAAGVYFCRLESSRFRETRKLTVVR